MYWCSFGNWKLAWISWYNILSVNCFLNELIATYLLLHILQSLLFDKILYIADSSITRPSLKQKHNKSMLGVFCFKLLEATVWNSSIAGRVCSTPTQEHKYQVMCRHWRPPNPPLTLFLLHNCTAAHCKVSGSNTFLMRISRKLNFQSWPLWNRSTQLPQSASNGCFP